MNRRGLDAPLQTTSGSENRAAGPPLESVGTPEARRARGHIRGSARQVPARPGARAAAPMQRAAGESVDSSELRS